MAKIDFNFSGWIRDAEVNEVVVTETGQKKDVTHVTPTELIKKLRNGTWCISLGDFLYDNRKDSEIEISDFAEGSII